MRRITASVLTAGACAVAISVAAQTPQTPPAPQTPNPYQTGSAEKKAEKAITLTGCLAKGNGADTYALSNVRMDQPGPVGTAGMAAEKKSEEAKANWALVSSGDIDLSKYVGHTVEVTGTKKLDSAAAAASPGQLDPGAVRKLNVTAIRDISSTCSQ